MIDLSEDEDEKEEPVIEEETEKKPKLPQGLSCPIYPASVKDIMDTVKKLDDGKIDEFDAVQEISKTLKQHRQAKLAALEKSKT